METIPGKPVNVGQEKPTVTLDEAMMMTGFGVYNIVHMLLSGLILMGVIMQSLVFGYVLPAAQCDLNLTIQQRGWIAAIPFLAIILMSYLWGWLADTRGRRFVMLFSMMISAAFSILVSLAPTIGSFGALSFLSAVFMSGPSAVVYTYLGEFTNPRHRDKIVTFGSSFVGIGTVMLPAVSWVILSLDFSLHIPFLGIDYRPWRLLVVSATVPFILGTIFLIFFPESPKFLNACGKQQDCLEVLKTIYAVNKRMPKETFPVKTLAVEPHANKATQLKGAAAVLVSMRDQTAPLFRSPLLPWTCLTCFVQFGLFATTNGFYVWFPTILNSLTNHEGVETRICDIIDAGAAHPNNGTLVECDDSINTATFQLSIYVGLVFCSMYLIVGFLVDTVGKKLILVAILCSTGLCGLAAHLVNHQQVAVVLFAVFQMCGACIGLMNAVAVELFPTKFRAMAVCLSMMMGRVGSMVGTKLIGVFLSSNCGLSFYLFGGIILVCALLCLTLPGKQARPDSKPRVELASNETHEPA